MLLYGGAAGYAKKRKSSLIYQLFINAFPHRALLNPNKCQVILAC